MTRESVPARPAARQPRWGLRSINYRNKSGKRLSLTVIEIWPAKAERTPRLQANSVEQQSGCRGDGSAMRLIAAFFGRQFLLINAVRSPRLLRHSQSTFKHQVRM